MSVGYVGNGQFSVTINGQTQTMNLASLELMIRSEQTEIYDSEIADQYAEVKEANQKRKALNELLNKMRQSKTEGRDDDWKKDSGKKGIYFTLPGYEDQGAKNIDYWRQEFGLGDWDVDSSKGSNKRDAQWDVGIESVKSAVDSISSDTELMMLRMRKKTDDRGTAIQQARTGQTNFKQLADMIWR